MEFMTNAKTHQDGGPSAAPAQERQSRTVFKSGEIAHVWAQQNVSHGRCPANMRFDGPSFYSYGTEIARFVEHKGARAVLLNETSYSVTTSAHNSHVKRAIAGHMIFRIGDIGRGRSLSFGNDTGNRLFEWAVQQSADCLAKAGRARSNKSHMEAYAAGWLEDARNINTFFGLRRKVDERAIERLREQSALAERKAKAQREERDKRDREEQTLAFEDWTNGLPHNFFNAQLFPTRFRVEEGQLVSSLGARVPLAEAKTALRFVLKHREGGWSRNGEPCPVGHYHLDSISVEGVKAGCHRISWEEIGRLNSILI
jgi:hypothetical protein